MRRWPSIEIDPGSILFIDDAMIAVDKEAGVLCDSSIDPQRDHLGAALRRWANDDGADFFPAHRLDLATSGVVVFARHRSAATALMHQFQARSVSKHYLAVVALPTGADWHVGHTVNRRSYLRHRKGVSDEVRSGGKPAESDFEILHIDGPLALVRATPATGRTHQLRVHLAALRAPIVGDDRYGGARSKRMWLHAGTLTLAHPVTNEVLTIRSRRTFTLVDGAPEEHAAGDASHT